MLAPAIVPLSITRGIFFQGIILQCKDGKVVVTGTLNPNVTGTYTINGQYNGLPLFILEGSPSTFCYFHPIALSYIISRTLSDGVFADYWLPSPAITEPTGTYLPQGAVTGTATATDNPANLTGYTVQSQVRRTPQGELLLNLNPTITNPSQGEITIPSISNANTKLIAFLGNFTWDVVPVDGSTNRLDPIVTGPFTISDNITQV